jgi:hypothetical protein
MKRDENFLPQLAKSRIVVLGNHKDRVWPKLDKFAPVLWGDSLRFLVSMAVQHCCPLRQGDCKNALCQGILPPEEVTIVRPPSGDPYADPQEYWFTPCMVYNVVPAFGTTKLMQSSGQLVLHCRWKIPASILSSFRIFWTRRAPHPSLLFYWVYTLMTLCISCKIQPSKLYFVAS